MDGIAVTSVLILLLCEEFSAETLLEYQQKRKNLIESELEHSLGNKVVLTNKELVANDTLMRWKKMNTDSSFKNIHYLNFSEPFFMYKDAMRRSKGYQMVRRMPKGAALHVHSTFMLEPEDLLKATYEEHLYACITLDYLQFRFSETRPRKSCSNQWILVSEARSADKYNISAFDEMFLDHFTVGLKDLQCGVNDNKNPARRKLVQTISTISPLICYRPVYEKIIYQSLQNLYDDNIMYAEIRTGLDKLYELNGTIHDRFYTAIIYKEVVKKFMKVNPDFVGIKLIITGRNGHRSGKIKEVRKDLDLARQVKKNLPELFAGFDLVGQGNSFDELVPDLLKAKDEMNYFFNPTETYHYENQLDDYLFDAILLKVKRIGHGNALIRHPKLMKAVYQNDIAIECNVISNSVTSLVQDLRNHALATYLAMGLPVVLASSNPTLWGAKPLSDDFYVTFVAISSKHADLRMLKRLAMNSIRFSALDDRGKTKLYRVFQKKWITFLNSVEKYQ